MHSAYCFVLVFSSLRLVWTYLGFFCLKWALYQTLVAPWLLPEGVGKADAWVINWSFRKALGHDNSSQEMD